MLALTLLALAASRAAAAPQHSSGEERDRIERDAEPGDADLEALGDALTYGDLAAFEDRLLDPVAGDDRSGEDLTLREAIETGSVFASSAFADPSELADVALRHQRPSRWGRLELTIAWRRVWMPPPLVVSLGALPHGPLAQTYDTASTLLVLATWTR